MQQLLSEGNSKLTDALKKKQCTSSSGSSHAFLCIIKAIDNTDKIDWYYGRNSQHLKPAEHESVDQRSKKQTEIQQRKVLESATCVLSNSKIPAAGELSKSGTKRSAVNRFDGTVPTAKKQAPNIKWDWSEKTYSKWIK